MIVVAICGRVGAVLTATPIQPFASLARQCGQCGVPRRQLGEPVAATAAAIAEFLNKTPDVVTQALAVLDKASTSIPTLTSIIEDPAFPQVMDRIKEMRAIAAAGPPAPPPAPSASSASSPASTSTAPKSSPPPGVGLQKFLPFMDAAIFYLRNPAVTWVVGGSLVLVVAGLGYGLGRRSGRRKERKLAAQKSAPAGFGYRRRLYQR